MTDELDDRMDLLAELNQMRVAYLQLKQRFDDLKKILVTSNCWLKTRDGFLIPFYYPNIHYGMIEVRTPLPPAIKCFKCLDTTPLPTERTEYRQYTYRGCGLEDLPIFEEVAQ
jgi:hypothetical protein